MKIQKILFFTLLMVLVLLVCIPGCNESGNGTSSATNIVDFTPTAMTDATSSSSVAPTSTPTISYSPIATQTIEPTVAPTDIPTASPTIKPTPTTEPTPTAKPTPVPTGSITLSVDFAEATGTKSKYTSRAPLKQVSFTVTDPNNTKGLSNTRVGHWFGSNTTQPIKFQNQYEAKGWNAVTIDTKTTEKVIYLTFDCGYENGYTEKILNTLKEKNCPAAFFCTLEYVERNQKLTARMIEDGHIVGNHSSYHPDYSKISRERMAREIQKLDNYLRVYFGYSSPYFRYPSGAYSENSMDLVNSLGYRTIFWSYAFDDYTESRFPSKEASFNYVTKRLHPGEILLLHAISPGNADALGDIIDYVRAQGYEFRTLDQYPW